MLGIVERAQPPDFFRSLRGVVGLLVAVEDFVDAYCQRILTVGEVDQLSDIF